MWNQASPKPNEDAQRFQGPASVAGTVTNPVRRPIEERRSAWFGSSVVLKGQLTSSEDLSIEGHVEGTIEVRDHTVMIGLGADVRATIVAKNVTINGAVIGKITASNKVEIGETGSVEGDVVSPRLAIAEGAVMQGRIDIVTGESETQDERPRRAAVV
jgi:cytoskeletal protein CcmA (bactofilin family)